MRVLPQGRFLGKTRQRQKRLCRTGMLGHKLLRRCSKAGCIFVIGQEDPPTKSMEETK